MNSFNSWKILGGVLFISTVIAVILYRAYGKNKTEGIYAQIACGFGGAALGIFGSVMLVDAFHVEGWAQYVTILAVSVTLGVGLQRAILGTEKGGPIDFN